MAAPVPSFVWPLVFAANLILVALLVLAVRARGGARRGRDAAGLGVALAAWFGLVIFLSADGVFLAGGTRPPTIALGVFPPILLGGLALAFSPAVRAWTVAIPQPWLVGIQSIRAVGLVFLVLLGRGVLPAQFALPAGWGDFAVGLTAPAVAYALSRRTSWAAPLALAWNVLGLLDLTVAIGVGALSAESAIRVFQDAPSTGAMAELPLSLIPTFAVPIFALLHLASLLALRAREQPRAALPDRPPRGQELARGGARA